MAAGETARLLASLELQDKLSAGLRKAEGAVGKFDSKWSKTASTVKKGLIIGGAAATAFIAANVGKGIQSLADLESATASVDGAIKQVGLTGQVTGAQIADWANQIEASVGAAFDDKDIVRNAATLIRYGKVTRSNLKPALVVMTDLAAKTGSVDSAATLLAKALADPAKAAGKLSRQGVILTKTQQDQIKAFTKAGKSAKAQKVLLDALADTTKGAAEATQGPYKRALSILTDVTEDAQRALAEGFLPVIERVATLLSTNLAKHGVIDNIREFGRGLASGLDKAVDFAQKIPWGTIGDSLKLAGAGARAVFDALTSLPPWIQTAVLTGWGLNKLSGGLVGDLIGKAGKSILSALIPAMGIKAGVVNVSGGVVNGGGVPGAAGAGGLAGLLTPAVMTAIGAIAIPAALALVQTQIIQPGLQNQANGNTQIASDVVARGNLAEMTRALDGLKALPDSLNPLERSLYELNANGVKVHTETLKAELERAIAGAKIDANPGGPNDRNTSTSFKRIADAVDARGDRVKGINVATTQFIGSLKRIKDVVDARGDRNQPGDIFKPTTKLDASMIIDKRIQETTAGVADLKGAAETWGSQNVATLNAAKQAQVMATFGAAGLVAGAIRSNPPPIVNVDVSVTPAQITRTTTIVDRYGPQNGSSGGDAGGAFGGH